MSPISSLPYTSGPLLSTAGSMQSPRGVNTQAFLTLLVAQSKNQNPLSPTDPGDILQQLASLSQVSGLQDIKATLERFLSNQIMPFDAANWIGRSALVPSNSIVPLADGSFAGEASHEGVGEFDVTFSTLAGDVVHTEHISGSAAGRASFSWSGLVNGVTAEGPLKVSATSAGLPANIAVWTTVQGIRAPTQSAPVIETPLGTFSPMVVLGLQ